MDQALPRASILLLPFLASTTSVDPVRRAFVCRQPFGQLGQQAPEEIFTGVPANAPDLTAIIDNDERRRVTALDQELEIRRQRIVNEPEGCENGQYLA